MKLLWFRTMAQNENELVNKSLFLFFFNTLLYLLIFSIIQSILLHCFCNPLIHATDLPLSLFTIASNLIYYGRESICLHTSNMFISSLLYTINIIGDRICITNRPSTLFLTQFWTVCTTSELLYFCGCQFRFYFWFYRKNRLLLLLWLHLRIFLYYCLFVCTSETLCGNICVPLIY